jgi:hypothetical protein
VHKCSNRAKQHQSVQNARWLLTRKVSPRAAASPAGTVAHIHNAHRPDLAKEITTSKAQQTGFSDSVSIQLHATAVHTTAQRSTAWHSTPDQ